MTAVEWLVEKLNSKYGNDDFIITHINEIEQAKQMEKEQMEISDEEIEKASEKANGYAYYGRPNGEKYNAFKEGWKEAIKWYREQLKSK